MPEKKGRAFEVVCLGEVVVDAFRVSVRPLSFSFFPGGASVNVAVALARLGVRSAVLGKVGEDPFGKLLRDTLQAEGVKPSLRVSKGERTSLTFVFGEREPCYLRYASSDLSLSLQDVDWTLFEGARVVHLVSLDFVDAPIRGVSRAVLRLSQEQGIFVFLDCNHRPVFWKDPDQARRTIREKLPEVDFLKLNFEEFLFLSGEKELERGAQALLAWGVGNLAVTLGEQGVFFANSSGQGRVPAFPVAVRDVVGCGDAFCAGVLARVLEEGIEKGFLLPLSLFREAVVFGSACGALTAQKQGAYPAFPRLEEAQEFLRNRPLPF